MVDRVTVGLFDLSSLELNETTRRSLVQSSQQLRHLCSVLEQLLLSAGGGMDRPGGLGLYGLANEEGVAELRTKCEAASLVNQYLKVGRKELFSDIWNCGWDIRVFKFVPEGAGLQMIRGYLPRKNQW